MAFSSVKDRKKPKRRKSIGQIVAAKSYDGFYLQIDKDCDLLLYSKDTGEYFNVTRIPVKQAEADADERQLFTLSVDLDSETQVELVGKD